MTVGFNTVFAYVHPHYYYYYFFLRLQFWTIIVSAAFKFILNQSRCSLEPKNFLKGFRTPHLRWSTLSSHISYFDRFSGDYVYSRDHLCKKGPRYHENNDIYKGTTRSHSIWYSASRSSCFVKGLLSLGKTTCSLFCYILFICTLFIVDNHW